MGPILQPSGSVTHRRYERPRSKPLLSGGFNYLCRMSPKEESWKVLPAWKNPMAEHFLEGRRTRFKALALTRQNRALNHDPLHARQIPELLHSGLGGGEGLLLLSGKATSQSKREKNWYSLRPGLIATTRGTP